jgi:hypothetical protein
LPYPKIHFLYSRLGPIYQEGHENFWVAFGIEGLGWILVFGFLAADAISRGGGGKKRKGRRFK